MVLTFRNHQIDDHFFICFKTMAVVVKTSTAIGTDRDLACGSQQTDFVWLILLHNSGQNDGSILAKFEPSFGVFENERPFQQQKKKR